MAAGGLTQQELAERLGLTTRQVHNLVKAGMPTRSRRGKVTYEWAECFAWYLDYKVERAVEMVRPADFESARARKMLADAQLAELELQKAEGQLVDLDYLDRQLTGALYRVRAAIQTVPAKFAHELVGVRTIPEAQARLQSVADAVLRQLSEIGTDATLDEGDDPEGDDGEPVREAA